MKECVSFTWRWMFLFLPFITQYTADDTNKMWVIWHRLSVSAKFSVVWRSFFVLPFFKMICLKLCKLFGVLWGMNFHIRKWHIKSSRFRQVGIIFHLVELHTSSAYFSTHNNFPIRCLNFKLWRVKRKYALCCLWWITQIVRAIGFVRMMDLSKN